MLTLEAARLDRLRAAGGAASRALRSALALARPGMRTGDVDAAAAASLARSGARSAPRLVYGFPGCACVSVNEEAAHGVPGDRIIEPGDLVNVDVCSELHGYYADCGLSVAVEPAGEDASRLALAAREVLREALASLSDGMTARALGALVEREAAARGYVTLLDLCGHGTGGAPHESPDYLECYDNPRNGAIFRAGMVLAVEVFLSTRDRRTALAKDGWAYRTSPGNLTAQAECTVLVTRTSPEILAGP